MDFRQIIETVGQLVDFAGVAVMVIGAVVSLPLASAVISPSSSRRALGS